jgi:hypothetical protein
MSPGAAPPPRGEGMGVGGNRRGRVTPQALPQGKCREHAMQPAGSFRPQVPARRFGTTFACIQCRSPWT